MIKKTLFGVAENGDKIYAFTIKKGNVTAEILNYGGIIASLTYPDKNGIETDTVLGYDTFKEYTVNDGYMGAIIGRVGNRIGGGKFFLDGDKYTLYKNDGNNTLHGGKVGFNSKIWEDSVKDGKLILTYLSRDGEEGFPGNLNVKVTYSVENDALIIEYEAESDKNTIINLTNHAYFNLSGGKRAVYNDLLYLNADSITVIGKGLIPTGEFKKVAGTAFDFTSLKPIGKDINADDEQLKLAGGYDHNFCINGSGMRKFAEVRNIENGIKMEGFTDQKGVQFYSGNFLSERNGRDGLKYNKRYALCLETQNYPDAVNKKNFPSAILKKGEKYHTVTEYKFGKI